MKEDPVIGIFCSDLHLSLRPPVVRAGEKDWFRAMERPLLQLRALQESHRDVPIFCAGDIFDRWNSPPELINWALEALPRMMAIPGQHDLPLHNLGAIKKSAFWTLLMANKLIPWKTTFDNINLFCYPWGEEIAPLLPEDRVEGKLNVALVHSYIWRKGWSYPNAPESSHVFSKREVLETYDVVVFGDNHLGFQCKAGDTWIYNCGAFMVRRADRIDYKPRVGLLYKSGKIAPYELDVSEVVVSAPVLDKKEDEDTRFATFLQDLTAMETTTLNFDEVIKQVLANPLIKEAVKTAVLEALDASQS